MKVNNDPVRLRVSVLPEGKGSGVDGLFRASLC